MAAHPRFNLLTPTGIGRNTRLEKQAREEDYTQWETRYRGLCRTTQYYVGMPAKRVVEYDQEVTTFEIKREEIKVVPTQAPLTDVSYLHGLAECFNIISCNRTAQQYLHCPGA